MVQQAAGTVAERSMLGALSFKKPTTKPKPNSNKKQTYNHKKTNKNNKEVYPGKTKVTMPLERKCFLLRHLMSLGRVEETLGASLMGKTCSQGLSSAPALAPSFAEVDMEAHA